MNDSFFLQRFQSQAVTQFLAGWQRQTPANLLLGLEWLFLIGATTTNILLPLPFQRPVVLSFWRVLTIAAFAIMGLKRPKQNLGYKTVYTIAEFGLVFVPIILDPRLSYIFPPLHLIILIRSCSMFGMLGQLITAIFGNLSFIIALLSENLDIPTSNSVINIEQFSRMMFTMRLNASFAFVLISTFILLLINALFFLQRSRQELTHAHNRLRQYSLRIEDQAMLQERNRIAREMHDALGHTLTAQSLQLDTVRCFWNSDSDRAYRALCEAKRLGTQALNDARQAIFTLRVDPIQGISLDDAITKLIQTFHKATGILPSCSIRLTEVPPTNTRLCVYRIVQEALTNIAKHSHATEVSIYLQTTPKQLNVLIQDNGIGFEPSQNMSGLGLQGMEERTLLLGGLFSIVSQSGLGCKVMAQIPLTQLP